MSRVSVARLSRTRSRGGGLLPLDRVRERRATDTRLTLNAPRTRAPLIRPPESRDRWLTRSPCGTSRRVSPSSLPLMRVDTGSRNGPLHVPCPSGPAQCRLSDGRNNYSAVSADTERSAAACRRSRWFTALIPPGDPASGTDPDRTANPPGSTPRLLCARVDPPLWSGPPRTAAALSPRSGTPAHSMGSHRS